MCISVCVCVRVCVRKCVCYCTGVGVRKQYFKAWNPTVKSLTLRSSVFETAALSPGDDLIFDQSELEFFHVADVTAFSSY